jgi:hypothetical protein
LAHGSVIRGFQHLTFKTGRIDMAYKANLFNNNGMMMKLNIPPNYFCLALVLSTVLYFLFPQYNTLSLPWNLTGLLLVIPGFYRIIHSWQVFLCIRTPDNYVD